MTDYFRPTIKRWPTVVEFATDVGCSEPVARQWMRSDSIPATWFAAIVRAAHRRGFHDVSAAALASQAELRRMAKESRGQKEAAA